MQMTFAVTSALSMPTALKTQLFPLLIVKAVLYGTMPKRTMLFSFTPSCKTTDRVLTSSQSSVAIIKLLPSVDSMPTLSLLSSTLTLATFPVVLLLSKAVVLDRKLS
jgi:hypothetical protein